MLSIGALDIDVKLLIHTLDDTAVGEGVRV